MYLLDMRVIGFTCILLRRRCSALICDGRLWRGTFSFCSFALIEPCDDRCLLSFSFSLLLFRSGEVLRDLEGSNMLGENEAGVTHTLVWGGVCKTFRLSKWMTNCETSFLLKSSSSIELRSNGKL